MSDTKGACAKRTRGSEEARHGGVKASRASIRTGRVVGAPNTSLFLKALGTIELPAIPRFVPKNSFTGANGIVSMDDNFRKFVLPTEGCDIPSTTLNTSELMRNAPAARIYADLGVDEKGEIALAHFFQVLQDRPPRFRTEYRPIGAYVIGVHNVTWPVFAVLHGDDWVVFARQLGDYYRCPAGCRFLSR